MKQRSDIDRVLQVWMADGPTAIPDRVVDVVAARIGVQRQRRAWPFRRRTTMNPLFFKLGAAAAAVLVIAVVGYSLLPRQQPGVGGQSTPLPTASPTAAPTSTPAATGPVALPDGVLAGGRYRIQPFSDVPSLSVVADIPAGWTGHPANGAITDPGGSNVGVLIGFMQADGLFSDPCHWNLDGTGAPEQPGDVVVGPTVDDLVAALKANTSYTSSAATPITFGQFEGQELELQLPGDDVLSTCDIEAGDSAGSYYVFGGTGIYAQGPDNRWQLTIVDVAGTRLVTLLSYFDGTPQADLDAARAIVESFEFTP